jgi:hypothetical protein
MHEGYNHASANCQIYSAGLSFDMGLALREAERLQVHNQQWRHFCNSTFCNSTCRSPSVAHGLLKAGPSIGACTGRRSNASRQAQVGQARNAQVGAQLLHNS